MFYNTNIRRWSAEFQKVIIQMCEHRDKKISRRFAKFVASRALSLPVAVFAFALIVRLWGIGHDLPYSYYGDEQHFVKRALSFGSGDLNPHWFHKPALYMYILFFEYGLYFCAGRIAGSSSSVSDFAVSYIVNPGPFYLIGRLTTALFSLGCVWGVYCIGERHFGRRVGLIAALLLAVTFGHVDASRVVKADIPTACFGIWSMYFLLGYLANARIRDLVLACCLAAAGTATKYYGVLMVVPLMGAPFLATHDDNAQMLPLRKRFITATIIPVIFMSMCFVFTPYNFLDPLGRAEFTRNVGDLKPQPQASSETDRPNRPVLADRLAAYSRVLISKSGMGPVITPICLAGLILFFLSGENRKLMIGGYAILFLVSCVYLKSSTPHPRYQTALYCLLVVPGGFLVVAVAEYFRHRKYLVYIGLLLALCHPLADVAKRSIELTKVDTRNVAKEWIESHLPEGAKLLVDENGPVLLRSVERISEFASQAKSADPEGQFTAHYDTYLEYERLAARSGVSYNLHKIRIPWWRSSFLDKGVQTLTSPDDVDMGNPLRPVGVETYQEYVRKGFQYAILHSDQYGPFAPSGRKAASFPAFAQLYRDLSEQGRLVKEFSPKDGTMRGPVVRIIEFVSRSVDGSLQTRVQ